jgi:hypothetical protein
MLSEPNFETEKELENALASAILDALDADDSIRAVVLPGFGLDLAVFTEKAGTARACFFEIKAPAAHHGRCGFGNQRGEGNQIRLLYDERTQTPRDQSQIRVFDPLVRWVIGNRSLSVGSPRFVFFTSKQAQDATMAGVRPGKQNNLRLSMFEHLWITWPALITQTILFVTS